MAKAVFQASSHSHYLDRPGELYHFPNMYLSRVARTVGDWVVFFEGRQGGSRGYYAVQKVEKIEADPSDPAHSFAILDRASALSFEQNVERLKQEGTPWETGLPLQRGSNTSAVRLITDADFAAIVGEGLRATEDPDALPRDGDLYGPGFAHPQTQFGSAELSGERAQVLASRPFRERSCPFTWCSFLCSP